MVELVPRLHLGGLNDGILHACYSSMMNPWSAGFSNKSSQATQIWNWLGEAATGYEAISAVERLQPDIVVMDIRMPGLDGIAAAREIRVKYPHVKIIGLSEYAYGYNTDAMEQAGAVGVYQKSSALEELYPAIKKVIGIHPAI